MLSIHNNIAVLQVKTNQQDLFDEINWQASYTKAKSRYEYSEKAHGRVESRIVEVFDFKHEKWPELLSCIKVTKQTGQKKYGLYEDSTSTRFFAVNTLFTAQQSDQITRGHWMIENRHHHIRDVQLREDQRRIRKKPEIMAVIRSFGYNIIQSNLAYKQFSTQIEYNKLNFMSLFHYKGVFL
jgi:predicted transposase YbfD/YdcC